MDTAPAARVGQGKGRGLVGGGWREKRKREREERSEREHVREVHGVEGRKESDENIVRKG